MIPRIRSQVRLLPGTPTQPDTSRNRPAGAPLRPPVIDGIEELDFLESGMPSSRLGCPLSLKTPNMGNTGIHAASILALLQFSSQTLQLFVAFPC